VAEPIPTDLLTAVRLVNARRRVGLTEADEGAATLEARHAASRRLCVYGSLAPGEPNHHVVAPFGGTWERATVHGDLRHAGWGADLGFPVLHWRAGGTPVAAQLLVSDALPAAWPALDAFEGPDYRRILAPVLTATGWTIANLYADARDDA
jgi:gamma-glutamylcyclotransferase (GGCT)/AIG2-like uncharacterized protein YtfP